MRRGNKSFWIEHEGVAIGINLGADYCAEHEWGIKDLASMLGIPSTEDADNRHIFSSKRFQVTRVPAECLRWVEHKTEAYLILSRIFGHEDTSLTSSVALLNKDIYYGQELRLPNFDFDKLRAKREKVKFEEPTELMTTGWSERDFGIHVKGPVNFARLKTIYEALLKKDLALFFGSEGNPFQNAGLQIIIVSQIPKEGEASIKVSLQDAYNLKKVAEKTGIAERLKKAGIRYYALSPRWVKDGPFINDKPPETSHQVIFWLNPMEQNRNNSGWYTVEQLDEWVKGLGPIPKKEILT